MLSLVIAQHKLGQKSNLKNSLWIKFPQGLTHKSYVLNCSANKSQGMPNYDDYFKEAILLSKLYLYLNLIINEEFERTSNSHAEGEGTPPSHTYMVAQFRYHSCSAFH